LFRTAASRSLECMSLTWLFSILLFSCSWAISLSESFFNVSPGNGDFAIASFIYTILLTITIYILVVAIVYLYQNKLIDSMKLIAFVGMPASGKSEAAAIAKKLDIPVVNMGDVVREETARQGFASDR